MNVVTGLANIIKNLRYHFLLRILHFLGIASVFFCLAAFVSFLLYILGNFQIFLVSTQLRLLSLVQIMSIIGIAITLYYMFFLFYWRHARKKRTPLRLLLYTLLMFVVNTVLAGVTLLIQEFTKGVV